STAVQKRIKLLENRLEKAYVKYNQSITHNKQLREQINNLRRERIMFESIQSNLERELVKLLARMKLLFLLGKKLLSSDLFFCSLRHRLCFRCLTRVSPWYL
ncbi:MAG: hypothetical protein ACK5UJ_04760, partial [Pseudobdellovibrionaceae bacterium]